MLTVPLDESSESQPGEPLLLIRNLSKQFPGVKALDAVDLDIRSGEIHILLGENGAGKSTLIKCIVGVERPDTGELTWQGNPLVTRSIKDAYDAGIAVIYQELNNVPCMSVMENLFLGNEIPISGLRGTVNWKQQLQRAKNALARVDCDIDPHTMMETLGMGTKQLIEIARAVDRGAKLIIMDEPTSSLSRSEIDHLLELMNTLRNEGVAILFITHKLDEAEQVGNRISVLKDGKKVGDTVSMEGIDEEQMIRWMVGRDLVDKYPHRNVTIGEEALRVDHLSGNGFEDISFSVHRGEVLGIFGLVGAGRTECMRALFGADPLFSGTVTIQGKPVTIRSCGDAIKNGLALVSENRKEEGLILIHDIMDNASLVALPSFRSASRLLQLKKCAERVTELAKRVNLRPLQIHKTSGELSGGNQQKVVVEKWLMSDTLVYIFDEPTKGVDVGAKTEIYSLMNQMLESGAAIIMVSSEMQEIIGMSDRIITFYEGHLSAELDNDETITQEKIMTMTTGGKKHA